MILPVAPIKPGRGSSNRVEGGSTAHRPSFATVVIDSHRRYRLFITCASPTKAYLTGRRMHRRYQQILSICIPLDAFPSMPIHDRSPGATATVRSLCLIAASRRSSKHSLHRECPLLPRMVHDRASPESRRRPFQALHAGVRQQSGATVPIATCSVLPSAEQA